ncbi:hypothetical protein [Treponema sp.]|uniref:hypothetical protein n=1 Tax=Treponema sp. TaxID=166 RepID=UPI0025E1C355|nr:hypothetical protein [Treponema sp.]MCR5218935.1 hypothetical protein [Treponema sp.]
MTENTRQKLNRLTNLKQRLIKENVIFENAMIISRIVENEKASLISVLKARAKNAGLDSETIKQIFGE